MASMFQSVRCTLALPASRWPQCRSMPSRPARSAARSRATDGAVLPGVTVEARSDVLPQPRETVTGANGEYRLPALPPGSYTLEFALSGMQTVTRKAVVQLAQQTRVDVTLGVGDSRRRSRSPPSRRSIDKDSATLADRLTSDRDHRPAGRPGLPRPAEADPGRAVHAGPDPRPERRRQRPGQRLPVRRRQRDPAAVRHALGRARVARHRPGHGDQGRRAGGRLRPLRRLLDGLRQQVGHRAVPRPGSATSSRAQGMAADLDSGIQLPLRAGPRLAQRRAWAARS